MKALLDKFEKKAPEIVFEWHDPETEAIGWVVINSLRGGAAGGGTRMRKGLDKHEVLSLAKTMEIKFTVAGPAIGGAKSGINFDPQDPRKEGVLKRWYKAVTPLLKNYYGTGGDLNVDEIHEVIPITERCGIWHPQEGVVQGHYQPTEFQKIARIGQLRKGVIKPLQDEAFSPSLKRAYTVADMITGYGVSEAVTHYYGYWGGMTGKRAIIQGWGNVAAAAAYYLAQSGVQIIGIIDRNGGILAPQGLGLEDVRRLFIERNGNALNTSEMQPFDYINERIWDIGAEIFIPAAASRLVTKEQIERLAARGLEVISCGANVPFADPEIFFGPTGVYADSKVSVIPDFIANCGMARVFAYLMSQDYVDTSDAAIFKDVSDTIANALRRVTLEHNSRYGIAQKAFEQAVQPLV